jgi:hypothetical protein
LLCFSYCVDRVLCFCLSWPQTTILLIYVSQVAGITSVPPHPAPIFTFKYWESEAYMG